MKKILLIGYGNIDRQDDGASWYVLNAIIQKFSSLKLEPGEILHLVDGPDVLFVPQLVPEIVEDLKGYHAVCFIDAHTGAYEEDIRIIHVESSLQTSAFTHHMTPGALLALLEIVEKQKVNSILVSIRGYEFGFHQKLSPQTQQLIEPAVNNIIRWINNIQRET